MGAAVAQRFGDLALKLWVIAASLVFYAAWYPPYVLVLLGSILVNFVFLRLALDSKVGTPRRYWVVVVGIAANIGLLGWFKYAGFFAFNMNVVFGTDFAVGQIALPPGISFFTFQKIALLVDVYRRDVTEVSLLDYAMFVTFFPQLIAGPIVLFPEVHDQYREPGRMRVTRQHCVIGLSIFAVGLFKKAAIADLMATYAAPVFAAAQEGKKLGTAEAWTGVLAYTMQLYFDFSGYSDMAVGLAAMLGIVLPFNFVSPYKATSIIDFWRRWHVTLSRFLRVYLYIPLGGNRKGPFRRYINLMIVMLIGGLWRGLDLCRMGRPARRLSRGQPFVARGLGEAAKAGLCRGRGLARRVVAVDVYRGGHRLGLLPRRQLCRGDNHPSSNVRRWGLGGT